MPNSSNTLRTAIDAAQAGGEVIRRYFRSDVAYRSKSTNSDLVSNVDLEAEKSVVSILREAFPDHLILGEECHPVDGDKEHKDLWIVDPLDGTTNFAHGVPHISCSVAHVRDGIARAGAVYNPIRDELYSAAAGEGARLNGEPIAVSSERTLDQSLIACGFYYDRGEMMEATLSCIREFFYRQIHGVRRMGTASLDLCQVASGSFGVYFEYKLEPWDFAAGALILEEAGGRVSNCVGEAVAYRTSGILASNGHLHQAALDIVSRNQPDSL